jgi:hypothetical protein
MGSLSQSETLGYTKVEGPLPFGRPAPLPEPFGLELDTSEF